MALYHVNEVTTFLHSPNILEEQSLKTALLKAYRTLISGISSSSNKPAKRSPKAIMKALAGQNKKSSGDIFADDGQQKDAHEAWVTIIDKFMNHTSYPNLKSFFAHLFEFNGSSHLQCEECRTTKQKVALYSDISLSFPNELENAQDRLTLKYMLDRYYGVETLEGDCAVGCDNCGRNQKTTKYLRLESEPQIAVIVLMRYVCNHQGEASKNTKLVGSLQYIHLSNSAVN